MKQKTLLIIRCISEFGSTHEVPMDQIEKMKGQFRDLWPDTVRVCLDCCAGKCGKHQDRISWVDQEILLDTCASCGLVTNNGNMCVRCVCEALGDLVRKMEPSTFVSRLCSGNGCENQIPTDQSFCNSCQAIALQCDVDPGSTTCVEGCGRAVEKLGYICPDCADREMSDPARRAGRSHSFTLHDEFADTPTCTTCLTSGCDNISASGFIRCYKCIRREKTERLAETIRGHSEDIDGAIRNLNIDEALEKHVDDLCDVTGCPNRKSEGKFVGKTCFPCYNEKQRKSWRIEEFTSEHLRNISAVLGSAGERMQPSHCRSLLAEIVRRSDQMISKQEGIEHNRDVAAKKAANLERHLRLFRWFGGGHNKTEPVVTEHKKCIWITRDALVEGGTIKFKMRFDSEGWKYSVASTDCNPLVQSGRFLDDTSNKIEVTQ